VSERYAPLGPELSNVRGEGTPGRRYRPDGFGVRDLVAGGHEHRDLLLGVRQHRHEEDDAASGVPEDVGGPEGAVGHRLGESLELIAGHDQIEAAAAVRRATVQDRHVDDLLGLSNLNTSFDMDRGAVKAVDGLDLTIPAGETVGLVGASGSGKSVVGGQTARLETFAVGALPLGSGTLGWSGSIMAGRRIETAQRYMETGTDWSETDSRRAMTRGGSFGAGLMLAVPLVTAARG
jgi:hypothetical protein